LSKPLSKPLKTIEELKSEAETTQGSNARAYDEKQISTVDYDFWKIEENKIFNEIITGNKSSQVAKLISKLNNSDWVKQGKEYIKEPQANGEICPFCQQETITRHIYQEIQAYFDETYRNKIEELKKLDSEYWREYQKAMETEEELLKIDFIKNKETEFKLVFKNFIEKVSSNWSKISSKLKSPNIVVVLESSILEQKALNEFLNKIAAEIKVHNQKISNKQKTKSEIVKEFWEIMRFDYDQTLEVYTTQNLKHKSEKTDIESLISGLKGKIEEQKQIIKDAQKEMVNIQDAIDSINSELIYFGLQGFSIVPAGNSSYKLQRPHEDITKFASLSEGEKTVISFLYFLELCKGKSQEDDTVTEKIIVIDDPISSLSHMYVFNISQLIKRHFFQGVYNQVFIFTHNLYFFHELLYKQKDDTLNLFRLCRSTSSQLVELCRKDIQNEYQSYWQILKDYDLGNATDVIMANAMRNILEHFFGFIEKFDFNELTQNLEKDERNKFFLRYINKESHSDPMNISDTKEINQQIFKAAFKKIFDDSGYIQHYEKMMKG
jgi:wobble nucleotide-excising tRNase